VLFTNNILEAKQKTLSSTKRPRSPQSEADSPMSRIQHQLRVERPPYAPLSSPKKTPITTFQTPPPLSGTTTLNSRMRSKKVSRKTKLDNSVKLLQSPRKHIRTTHSHLMGMRRESPHPLGPRNHPASLVGPVTMKMISTYLSTGFHHA
jgi:hypothetical protein